MGYTYRGLKYVTPLILLVVTSVITEDNIYCSFEDNNFCGIAQDTSDDFDWTIKGNGPTESYETGPDAAFDGLYYIYIEASNPRNDGDKARIILPPVNTGGSYLLTFNFNMYGHHINTLNVYSKLSDTNILLWNKSGQQGKAWLSKTIEVELEPGEQIIFEGVRGTGYSGDIALDNIWLKINSDAVTKRTTTTTTTSAPNVVATLEPLLAKPVYQCTFEQATDVSSFCGMYKDIGIRNVAWEIHDSRETLKYSPPGLAISNNFMFVDTRIEQAGLTARATILTDAIIPMNKYCVEFRYYLWGNPNDSIHIELRYGLTLSTVVFQKLQNSANQWQFVRKQLFFRIKFGAAIVGVPGKGTNGIIAVDDIKITPCELFK